MSMKDVSDMLKKLHGKSCEIGWFESNKYTNGVPVASVAAWNDLGVTDEEGKVLIPSRPFVRTAIADGNASVDDEVKRSFNLVIQRKITPDQVLGRVGLHFEAAIVDSIKNGGWVANAESTVARKGFDKPLIGVTGLLWQSVTHKTS